MSVGSTALPPRSALIRQPAARSVANSAASAKTSGQNEKTVLALRRDRTPSESAWTDG